jgi:hypothetical protein
MNYERQSRPTEPTRVTVVVNFASHGHRIVTALTLPIIIPENDPEDFLVEPSSTSDNAMGAAAEQEVTFTQVNTLGRQFDGSSVSAHNVGISVNGGGSTKMEM